MITYRPHIDGLRAIAVLSVLAFHLDEALLPGGFVGVDIFFVISGYLISRLIVKELQHTGDFSFKNFYIRRVRRLFPAMFATFSLCLLAGYFLLSPQHLSELAASTIYAVLSVSNFYFWNTASYFDTASQFKPLLHTWSLSVEEQFYLIWPLMLFLLYRLRANKLVLAVIAVLGLASLALNHFVFSNRAWFTSMLEVENFRTSIDLDATAFYLLPFRVYEFAIGAALIFYDWEKLKPLLKSCCLLLGLALIAYSFVFINEKMDFPSYRALWPCVGAALVIMSGSQHALAKVLTNPLMVGVGLISYSLYLVHWPIIVFYEIGLFRKTVLTDYVVISIASVLIAYLFYRFVEQPFRKPRFSSESKVEAKQGHKPFLTGALGAALLVCSLSAHAIWTNGWSWRYPAAVLEQFTRFENEIVDYTLGAGQYYAGDFANDGKPKVLVIGDSLTADLINAFYEGGSIEYLDLTGILINHGCRSLFPLADWVYRDLFPGREALCIAEHKKVMAQEALISQADTVILASHWWDARYQRHVVTTAEYLRKLGVANVMVLGEKVQSYEGLHLLASYPLALLKKLRVPANPTALYQNEIMENLADGYEYFDLLDQFCNDEGCRQTTDEGFVIVFDSTHMTPEGAEYVGRGFTRTEWFKKILNSAEN